MLFIGRRDKTRNLFEHFVRSRKDFTKVCFQIKYLYKFSNESNHIIYFYFIRLVQDCARKHVEQRLKVQNKLGQKKNETTLKQQHQIIATDLLQT